MQDPVRQSMLARMGIQGWQLRRPALLGGAPEPTEPQPASGKQTQEAVMPDGKLWLLAPQLPAQPLLADICQLLGITPEEVSLLGEMPAGEPPLLWLTEGDPRWPDALICPLAPTGTQKRALWQQLRQRLAATAA